MALKVGELFASFSIDSSDISSAMNQIEQSCGSIGSSMMKAGAVVTAAVTAPLVKLGKDMYTSGTEFEAQMDKVFAIGGSKISENEAVMSALTAKALEMGSTTEWTSKQAGEALEYMAMAGWEADEMLAALPGVINLATAAGTDLGTTSDILTDAMTAFGLSATDMVTVTKDGVEKNVGAVQYFTDILAATSSNANTNVQLLGESFKFVAPIAGAFGYKLDDVSIALGLMANNGIKGSMAGTSLSRIIQNMTKPSDSAAAAMEKLGVSITNSDGSMKSLEQIMKDFRRAAAENKVDVAEMANKVATLNDKLESGKITEEEYEEQLGQINGVNKDFLANIMAITGARGLPGLLAIMNASEKDFNDLTNAVKNANGETDKMAETMRNNVKGAMEILKSAITGLEIELWSLVKDTFTETVKKVTNVIDKFRQMDEATKKSTLNVAALAAAAGPLLVMGGNFVKMIPSIVKAISSLTSPMGLAVAGIALFAVAAVDSNNTVGKAFESMCSKTATKMQEWSATIRKEIPNISSRMGDLITSLTNGVKTIVPEFAKLATTAIEGLMTAITNNAGGLASLGTTIITTLVDGIADSLPTLIPAAVQMIGSLAAAIIENIPELVKSALNLMDKFKEAIAGINWTETGKKILDAIEKAISGLDKVFTDWFTNSSNTAKTQDWASIGTTVIDLIFDGTTKVVELAGKLAVDICEALGQHNWADDAAKLKEFAKHMIEKLVELLPTVFETGGKVISAGVKLADEIVKSLGEGFKDTSGFKLDFAGIVQSIVNGLSEAVKDLPTLVGDVLSVGAQIANSLMTALADALSDIEGSHLGESFGTTLANLVAGLFGAITDFATNEDVKSFVKNLGRGIIAALGTIGETLGSFVGTLLKKLFSKEGLAQIYEAGKSVIELLIKGIEAGISGIFNFAFNVIDGILEGLGILDPDTKKAYEQAMAAAAECKSVVQQAFEEGFYFDENDVNLGDVNTAIMEALSLSLTGADIDPEAMQNLALSIKGKISDYLGHEVSENAAGYEFGNLMYGIRDQLVNAANQARFGEGDFSGLDVKNILGPFLDTFGAGAESISSEMYDTIANYLINGGFEGENDLLGMIMKELIGSPDSSEAQEAVDAGKEAVEDACKKIYGTANEAAANAQSEIDGITISWDNVFTSSLAEVSSWQTELEAKLSEMGVSAGSLLGVALPEGVAEGLATGQMSVEEAAEQIVKAAAATDAQVTAAKEENKKGGSEAASGVSEGMDAEADGVTTSADNLLAGAKASVEEFAETFKNAGTDATNGIETTLTNGASDVGTAAETVSDAAVQKFLAKMTFANGQTIAQQYLDGVKKAFDDALTPISTSAQSIADNSYNALNDKLTQTNGETIGSSFTGGIKAKFDESLEPINTAAKSIADNSYNSINTKLTGQAGKTIGNNFLSALKQQFVDFLDPIATAARNVADKAKTAFSGTLTISAGSVIGYNFANGIASGIRLGLSNVINAAIEVARAAVRSAKSELVIKSPSRVARDEIGLMFDRGLVEGLNGGIDLVEKAATNVSDSLRDSFYVQDPSNGTVYTSNQQARATANETAAATSRNDAMADRAERIGRAIADRIIESGVLDSDIYLDNERVGRKVATPVSSSISRKTKQTIHGRSLQGVMA